MFLLQRAGLHDADLVADVGVVGLVVGVQLLRAHDELVVLGVADALDDGDDGGLVHLVGHDDALADLAALARLGARPLGARRGASAAVGGRRSRSGHRCRLTWSSLLTLGLRDLALADVGVDAGDLAADLADLGVVVELAGGVAEAQVERLLLGRAQLVDEVAEVDLGELGRSCCHQKTSSRVMTRALIGSFWIALSRATAACSSFGNESSNSTRPGLDDGDPELGVALAGTHAGLGRLLGDGLVREDVDPDLAATLDGAGHGDTGGLDLAGGEPARLERLDAVLAEGELGAALGHAVGAAAVVLAVCDLAGHQHGSVLPTEVRCLVPVVGPAGDVLFFVEQLLELGIGFLQQRGVSGSAASAGGGPADDTTWRGSPAWPDVSPTAIAASRADLVVALRLVGEDVALVDPHLDADAAAGGAGLAEAVVDVGAQRVQRHATFAVPLGAAHLGAAEATRALDPDAERTGALCVLHGALHRPAEGDAVGELVGDALGDERGVELGGLDLDDVELHLGVAGDLGDAARAARRPGRHDDR